MFMPGCTLTLVARGDAGPPAGKVKVGIVHSLSKDGYLTLIDGSS